MWITNIVTGQHCEGTRDSLVSPLRTLGHGSWKRAPLDLACMQSPGGWGCYSGESPMTSNGIARWSRGRQKMPGSSASASSHCRLLLLMLIKFGPSLSTHICLAFLLFMGQRWGKEAGAAWRLLKSPVAALTAHTKRPEPHHTQPNSSHPLISKSTVRITSPCG